MSPRDHPANPSLGTVEDDVLAAAGMTDDPARIRALHGLRALMTAADRYRHAVSASFGIGVTDSHAISNLNLHGPMPQHELATRVGITRGSSTAMIDRLERSGIVRRTPAPNDRRSLIIELTDYGRSMLTTSATLFISAIPTGDPAEIERLADDLLGLAERIDHLVEHEPPPRL